MTHRRAVRRLTVLSAFTGAGGLDLGLERAGFETVAAIEFDPSARQTIRKNRPTWNLLETPDIIDVARYLRPASLGLRRRQLSILAGGPPCQPFSKAAQWADSGRRGLKDPRTKCIHAFMRLAERFLPRIVLIENVPGFATGRTSTLAYLQAKFRRINNRFGTKYRLEHVILDASQFGVPQKRQRAILIARRDGRAISWPQPTHSTKPVRAYDALFGVTSLAIPAMTGYWGDLLPSIPEGRNYLFHTANGEGLPLFGDRRRYWSFLLKLAKDEPAWTIPAQPGPATGPFHWKNRPLSIEEMQRLQTFPRSWRFEGSHRARARQVGNATPPLLAEILGRVVASRVYGRHFEKALTLKIARRRTIPRRKRPALVPRKYYKHRNQEAAHPGVNAGPGAVARQQRELLRLQSGADGHINSRELLSRVKPNGNERHAKLPLRHHPGRRQALIPRTSRPANRAA